MSTRMARDEEWADVIEKEWAESGVARKKYTGKKIVYGPGQEFHGVLLEGTKKAGITLFHTAAGPRDLFLEWTQARLGALGYSVFIADLYGDEFGQGWQADFSMAKRHELSEYTVLRARAAAALDEFQKYLEPEAKIGAIGYCLGGRAAAELAKAGDRRLQAIVSFHGVLDDATPVNKNLDFLRMLILHGDKDAFVPRLDAFRTQMHQHGAPVCDLVSFSGAYHGFTNPGQILNEKAGFDYNPRAAALAWDLCLNHLGTYLLYSE